MINFALAFVAGFLTTLSPCVLPMLPMMLGSSLQKNKLAPLYMSLGLILSFTTFGFIISRFGSLFGIESDQIKFFSGILLLIFAIVMLSQKLQDLISEKMAFISAIGSKSSQSLSESSVYESILLGSLMGLIWSPCSGPTLGIAVSLASQKEIQIEALIIMFIFSIGATLPILGLSYGLKSYFLKNKLNILNKVTQSKKIFGILMLITGLLITFKLDKIIEKNLLDVLPDSWTELTTQF